MRLSREVRGPMSAGVGVAEERQRELEFLAQDGDRALDAGRAAGRQRPVDRPADEDALGTERTGDGDVEAAAHAAVDPDLGPAADGRDDLGQHVDRGRHPVELARAVVADDDRVDAVLDGQPGVLGGQDPLHHERQRRPGPDRREVGPHEAAMHRPVLERDGHPSAARPWLAGTSVKLPSAGRTKPARRSRSR